jgi:hypothetical protein
VNWQAWISGAMVVVCSAYATWRLMPASLRGRVLAALGRPQPALGACGGCDNCGDKSTAPATPGTSVIKIVRRQPDAAKS